MKLVTGGVVATVLLALYVYAVVSAILMVMGCGPANTCASVSLTEGMIQALTLIGGLVSALVIAELAITQPGEAPMKRMLESAPSMVVQRSLAALTYIYLLVWIATGVSAYVVGQMLYPGQLRSLSDLGQSWLGLAVTAGYAYFGIKPR